MSVLPQELMRKISSNTREPSENSSATHRPHGRFKELMRVEATDESTGGKNFFTLVEEDEEKIDGTPSIAPALALQSLSSGTLSQALGVIAAPRVLSSELQALFEKMASTMLVMTSSRENETTLFLDKAGSVFFGTRITIREFSTAPKAFNVEIASHVSAMALIESGKQDLLAAFQNGKFNFSIHRLDTQIEHKQERPVLHRKESSDHGHQDRKGGREQ